MKNKEITIKKVRILSEIRKGKIGVCVGMSTRYRIEFPNGEAGLYKKEAFIVLEDNKKQKIPQ